MFIGKVLMKSGGRATFGIVTRNRFLTIMVVWHISLIAITMGGSSCLIVIAMRGCDPIMTKGKC